MSMTVILHPAIETDNLELYVFLDHPNGGRATWKPVKVEVIPTREGERNDPFLTLPCMIARQFFPSLAAELDRTGNKPPERSFAKGELLATKAYLTDLRVMLKLAERIKSA